MNALAQRTADELKTAKVQLHTAQSRITELQAQLDAAQAEVERLRVAGSSHFNDELSGGGAGHAEAASSLSASQAAAALGDMPPPATIIVSCLRSLPLFSGFIFCC